MLHAPSAVAQTSSIRLRTAGAGLDEGFTRVTSVRELSDGRVLVADGAETRLHLADFRTGSVRVVGAEGRGPGEYRSVGRLHPLGGDSTLLEDSRNGRWLVLDGARFVGTINYGVRHREPLPVVTGSDRSGRVLISRPTHLRPVPGDAVVDERGRADSLLLTVMDAATGRTREIGRIRGSFRGMREARRPAVKGGPPVSWLLRNPMAAEEQALLFSDGWIALALTEPYRVDWIMPDGTRSRGAPLPFEPVPVDARQKAAAVARAYHPDAGWTAADMPADWPKVVPPFMDWSLLAAPGGTLVIRRTPLATVTNPSYDVVDRRGRLARRLTLSPGERLVGFGASAVYVMEEDEDGLQWIRRHPWP